jgi:tetratricopeptide (TPR) repeat protein
MSKIKTKIFLLIFFFPIFLLSQEIEISTSIINALNKIDFKNEKNFSKARSFYLKSELDSTLIYSMKQLDRSSNNELSDYCHYFRGHCFLVKKLFKEAKIEMNLVSKKFPFRSLVNDKLGRISIELKEFEKAIHYFKEIEKLPFTNTQGYKISDVYENLGICYLHLNQFNLAEKYLLKQKTFKEQDTLSQIYLNLNLGNLYYSQYKDKQAIPYFESAYKLSKKFSDLNLKRKTSKNMAVVEENRSNYKQALVYRKEFDQWNDSVNNQNKIWAVADFEKKFAVSQKQKQIKVLEVENQLKNSQRNWLFFFAISLFLLLTAGVYFYAQKVKNAKIILLQKNKLDELNATKDQLFSIVSHDLRSSVNALKTSNAKLSATLETKNYDELNQLIIQNSGIANGAYSLLDNLLHWALLQTKQLYFHKESVHLSSIVQQIE